MSTPTSAAAMIAFRRKGVEGEEENEIPRMILPSPRREPLRLLPRNNNSKESLSESFSGKIETPRASAIVSSNSNSKPPLINKPLRQETEESAKKTPLKTPSSLKSTSPPLTGGRTPNAGKILSPLPLQPRKLQSAQKRKVNIDAEEFLSRVPNVLTPNSHKVNDDPSITGDESIKTDGGLLDLRLSTPFEEFDSDDDDDDSLGWTYTIDDFKFIRKLGSGGTADVYEVLEIGTCAMYALKVQRATEDALCELDLHIPLKHKNICQMFDYFYSDGKPFLEHDDGAMDRGEDKAKTRYLCTMLECCDYGDLHDLIDEHVTVPEAMAAKAMREAIHALQYLHSKDIIHCDIKPANWLMDGEDDKAVVKLADFGMAVTSDAKEVVGGSPVYMAPEHLLAWRDLTGEFDHRTDIYSLGVVLYELLMGYLPYEVLEANKTNPNKELLESEDEAYQSLATEFFGLSVSDPSSDEDRGFPVLDLRKLNDASSDEPFYIPPPIFVEEISMEAQDLIMRLMEPSVSKRITLEEALEHKWFSKALDTEKK